MIKIYEIYDQEYKHFINSKHLISVIVTLAKHILKMFGYENCYHTNA